MTPGIYTSTNHLLCKGPNQSFGNHVLHLYAVYSFAQANGLPFFVTADSNLDEMFDLEAFKCKGQPSKCIFDEEYGGNLIDYYHKDIRNINKIKRFLSKKEIIDQAVYISGWFYNKLLLPDISFFDRIKIKSDAASRLESKSYIFNADHLVLHYRGTDFKNHSIGFGDIRLQGEYYDKCIDHFCMSHDLKKIVLIADDVDEALNTISAMKRYDVIVEIGRAHV